MAIKGALTTTFAISKTKPTQRDEAGYDALKKREITPRALVTTLGAGFLVSGAQTTGAATLSVDQASAFTFAADIYLGARFTIAGDTTVYTVTGYTGKSASNTDAVDLSISPALAADAADNAVITALAADNSLVIPKADYDTLIAGEPVSLSNVGSLTGLAVNAVRYLAKFGNNKIAFANTRDEAVKGADASVVALGGTLGTAKVESNNFKLCGEATNIGDFGPESNVVRVNNLASGATRKFKGSFDNGTIQADLLFDGDDVGQAVLEEASGSTLTYVFHVQFPEPEPEEFYFEALVASLKRVVGGPNDAIMLRASIEIDHNAIIEGRP